MIDGHWGPHSKIGSQHLAASTVGLEAGLSFSNCNTFTDFSIISEEIMLRLKDNVKLNLKISISKASVTRSF